MALRTARAMLAYAAAHLDGRPVAAGLRVPWCIAFCPYAELVGDREKSRSPISGSRVASS